MQNNFEEQFNFKLGGNSDSVRERTFPTKIYTLYLDGEIGAPSEYRDHMEALESANEWDEVKVVISSPGGRLDAGLMLINGIRACRAPVTAHIHDQCGSMATGIALSCSNWMLGDFAYFFVHTASWGVYGKDSEVRSQVQFMDKRIDKFLHDMYDGFMSAEEISLVSKGQDMWIDAEELGQRLAQYQEYRNSQPCPCGSPECESNQEQEEEKSFSLEDMMTDIATKAVDQAISKLTKKYDLIAKAPKPKATKKVVDKPVEEA